MLDFQGGPLKVSPGFSDSALVLDTGQGHVVVGSALAGVSANHRPTLHLETHSSAGPGSLNTGTLWSDALSWRVTTQRCLAWLRVRDGTVAVTLIPARKHLARCGAVWGEEGHHP